MNERIHHYEGHGKHRKLKIIDGFKYFGFTKNFFSRPSSRGFANGMPSVGVTGPTADYTIPGFKNDETYYVCTDNSYHGLPWYLGKGLHIFMCLAGLGFLSFAIIICAMPAVVQDKRTKNFRFLKFHKIMLH